MTKHLETHRKTDACDRADELVPENGGADDHREPDTPLPDPRQETDRDGNAEGVKLEEQYLITDSGAEQLSSFPLDL